jgi:sugar lactone lactonase YvrE
MKKISLILIVLAGLIVPLACTSSNPTGPLATYNLTATFTNTSTPTPTNWAGYTSTTTPGVTSTFTLTVTNTATMTNTLVHTATPTNTPTSTNTLWPTPVLTSSPWTTSAPPNGLTYDGSVTVYVAEGTEGVTGGVIQMFNGSTGASLGTMTTYDGTHLFSQPNGVVCSISGGVTYLFVLDQMANSVYQINLAGPTLVDTLTTWSAPLVGQPTVFSNPEGIAADSSGNIYVADTGNDYVEVFNSSLSTSAGNIHEFGGFGSGNGQFNNPSALTVDGSGNIYVADASNQRIQIFTSSFTYSSQFSDGTSSDVYGITLNGGNIFLADSGIVGQVTEYSSSGLLLTQGLGISPTNNPSSDSLVFIGSNLLVGDYSNNQLYLVTP